MHTKTKIVLFLSVILSLSKGFAQPPNALYKSGFRLGGTFVTKISNDVNLSGNNSESLVTEHAVKTYVDNHSGGTGGTDTALISNIVHDSLANLDLSAAVTDTALISNIVHDSLANLSYPGGGDMLKSVYDPTGVNSDAFDYNNMHNKPTIPVSSVAGRIGDVTLTKSDVGLTNADNTSDLNKPISTATQNGLNLKLNKTDTTDKWLPKDFYVHDTLEAPLTYTPGRGIHLDAAYGTATLSAGTVTVSCTAVSSSSKIFISVKNPGGTQGFLSAPSGGRTAGMSFIINSTSATETSTIDWEVINP